MTNKRLGAVRLAMAFFCLAAVASAQSGEDILGEVSTYTGWSSSGLGVHPVFGGSTAIVSKYAVGLVDTSFLPLGIRTLRYYDVPTNSSQLFDFNFTVQIQVPVNHRITPYGLFGPSVLYNRYQRQTTLPPGPVVFTGQSDFKFGFEVGGGFRYYVKEAWGVKTEYRYTISSQNFGRIVGGVFYQFDAPWPFLPFKARSRVPSGDY
jgi:opacity protein-like surface antigen